jgi:hypothetical protein
MDDLSSHDLPSKTLEAWSRLTNLDIDPSRMQDLLPLVERRLTEMAELAAVDPGDVEMTLVFPWWTRGSFDAE